VTLRNTIRRAVQPRGDELHAYEVFSTYQTTSWQISDIPWDEFDPSRVRPEYITFAKGAVMGESTAVAAVHGFLNEFMDDYDLSAYICLWGYQELQHNFAFRRWLELAGESVPYARVNAMRKPFPPGITPAATLATNIISEIATNHMYRCVARDAEEPVIVKLMKRAGGDEARHAREFAYYCARRIAEHPEERTSVLETLYIYLADPEGQYRHPVARFKGDEPEVLGHETIEDVFRYFARVDDGTEAERIRRLVFEIFSELIGTPLAKLSDVRRAIADTETTAGRP
jgi:hypothetical protein